MACGVDCGMIDMSPVIGVMGFADKKGDRKFSHQELVALGEALRKAGSKMRIPLLWPF